MIALVLIGAALAVIYGMCLTEAQPSATKSQIKTGAVAALAMAGAVADAPAAIIAGLALGALGDLLLSRPSLGAFLGGMAAFAAGHLAYLLAFWPLIGDGLPPAPALAVGTALFASGRIWLWPYCGGLTGPVIGYSLIIAVMLTVALMLGPLHRLVQVGALMFTLSDILLALRLFRASTRPNQRILSIFLWPIYWAAQLLMLWAFVPA